MRGAWWETQDERAVGGGLELDFEEQAGCRAVSAQVMPVHGWKGVCLDAHAASSAAVTRWEQPRVSADDRRGEWGLSLRWDVAHP